MLAAKNSKSCPVKRLTLKVNLNKRSSDSGQQSDQMDLTKDKVRSVATTPSTDVPFSSGHDSSFDEYYDCNTSYDDRSFSSHYEDSVSSLSGVDHHPMIEIIQEITEKRVVRSTVRLNKSKIQKYRQTMPNASPPPPARTAATDKRNDTITGPSKRRKSKQKSVRDNVHNENLDQNRDHSVDREVTSDATGDTSDVQQTKVSTIDNDSIQMGKLESKCGRSAKPVGRLMSKRLERDRMNAERDVTNIRNDENGNKIPPIKPPRIFANSSSTTSSASSKRESDCGNSSATVAIEELHGAPAQAKTENKRIGWQFCSDIAKPTCPPPNDKNQIEWLWSDDANTKYGWTNPFVEKSTAVQQVYNMLNYDQRNTKDKPADITSYNLLPEPQRSVGEPKESIDTVDFAQPSQQQCDLEKFANTTMFSTPIKSALSAKEICLKCQLKIQKQPSPERGFVRQSFKKNALKRTKSFFRASRHKISAKQPSPYPKRMAYSDSEDYTPAKSDVTEQMNRSLMNESGKKSVKTLGFTPLNFGKSPGTEIDEPKPNNRTPPQKPVRRKFLNAPDAETFVPSTAGKCVSEPNFDFRRIIHSPKRDRFTPENLKRSFKLSPKRLFKTSNTSKQSSPKTMDKSYKSFADTEDDFIVLMGEYLQRMCRKINGIDVAGESLTNGDAEPPVELSRAASVISDTLATVIPPQLVAIDCHPCPGSEPIYAEIPVSQLQNAPEHFNANSNPSAVYAIVNKATTPKLKSPFIHDSFQSLNLGNDLSVSIENFLDRMNDGGGSSSGVGDGNNDHLAKMAPNETQKFCFSDIDRNQMRKCEQERLQLRCVDEINYADTASISTTSHLTECICDDVGHGDGINDDIAVMIDRIESMDPFLRNSQRAKAVPEESDISFTGHPDCYKYEEPNYWETNTGKVCFLCSLR